MKTKSEYLDKAENLLRWKLFHRFLTPFLIVMIMISLSALSFTTEVNNFANHLSPTSNFFGGIIAVFVIPTAFYGGYCYLSRIDSKKVKRYAEYLETEDRIRLEEERDRIAQQLQSN